MIRSAAVFKRIAHVCLTTHNLELSIAFYRRLGCREVFRFTRNGRDSGVYLEIASEHYVEIFEESTRGPVINNGITHFCLETDDIDGVIEHCTREKITFTPKRLGCDHTWQIWLIDPDGNRFEVHQYTAESTQRTGRGPVEADW